MGNMIKRKILKIKAWLVMKRAEKMHQEIMDAHNKEMNEVANLHRGKNYRYGTS